MADFDWGNLLYLLALILFAVFGSRRKKKPVQTSTPDYEHVTEEEANPGFFEKFVMDKYHDQKQPDYHSGREYEYVNSEIAEKEPDKSEVGYKNPEFMSQSQTVFKQENQVKDDIISTEIITSSSYQKQDEILGEPFDVKKAVIYSEILKRKHF